MLNPVPVVMVSCKGITPGDKPNIITIAWVGTVCSDPPMLSISVRKSRFSHSLISSSGEFCVNLTTTALLRSTDFCGVKSGRDVDKFEACSLTPLKVDGLYYSPGIAESPLIIGCKLKKTLELGSHDMFIGEVISVMADESLYEDDRFCLDKAGLIAFNHGEYFPLKRDKIGFFGFSVASPAATERRMGNAPAKDSRD